jgi:hypothetical protein
MPARTSVRSRSFPKGKRISPNVGRSRASIIEIADLIRGMPGEVLLLQFSRLARSTIEDDLAPSPSELSERELAGFVSHRRHCSS